jgi:hypothetical protein
MTEPPPKQPRAPHVWIAWATDDLRIIACHPDLPTVLTAAANDCGCQHIGWTELDNGWTYLNNLWGYIIRKCLIVGDAVPPQRKPHHHTRRAHP